MDRLPRCANGQGSYNIWYYHDKHLIGERIFVKGAEMINTIGLIRHGVTDWNHLGKAQGISDVPLNEEGVNQAIALANRLSLDKKN